MAQPEVKAATSTSTAGPTPKEIQDKLSAIEAAIKSNLLPDDEIEVLRAEYAAESRLLVTRIIAGNKRANASLSTATTSPQQLLTPPATTTTQADICNKL